MSNTKMVSPFSKTLYRQLMKQKLASLSKERRASATKKSFSHLSQKLSEDRFILSFASKPEEIDLWPFNHWLMERNLLVLPRVEGCHLSLFHIQSLEHLELSSWKILEPIPSFCTKISSASISTVLVPGLAFDALNHRLGYGKGFYDRLLATLSPSCLTIGIGFTEQKAEKLLPVEETDVPVQEVFLF